MGFTVVDNMVCDCARAVIFGTEYAIITGDNEEIVEGSESGAGTGRG